MGIMIIKLAINRSKFGHDLLQILVIICPTLHSGMGLKKRAKTQLPMQIPPKISSAVCQENVVSSLIMIMMTVDGDIRMMDG